MSLEVAVTKRLGNFTLDVALNADAGITVLFGPSGSGKTQTLRCIAGLTTPDAGRIMLNGQTLFDSNAGVNLPTRERRVGYLFQHYALFPHMTVAANIGYALHSLPRADRDRRVAEMLRLVGLTELAARLPRQLSGGQQQRAALARALAINPRLLLLDEPFSALDAGLHAELREELALLHRQFPVTTLLVTHDLRDAFALADHVAVYSHGRVLQLGSRDAVFQRPASLEAAHLTGARNLLAGTVTLTASGPAIALPGGQRLFCQLAEAPQPGAPVTAVVRPEYLRVLPAGAVPDEDESAVPAVVEQVLPQGATVAVWARVDGGGPLVEAAVPALDWARRPYQPGQPVQVAAPRWAVWVPPVAE